ncbi:MAG: GMC family oxidoreductase [Methylocella sp.]
MLEDTEFDAIVVGSGAAGGWAAKELTERGMRVLLLEAGREVDQIADFPPPGKAGHHLVIGNPIVNRARAAIFGGQPIQARCVAFAKPTKRFFVSDRENPYTTPRDKPFNWFRGRQVGGRLYTWGRIVFRMSDSDFKAASRDGYGADWPISYDDLSPYYDHVEEFLGVNGTAEGLPGVPDGKYAKLTTLNAAEQKFRDQVQRVFPGSHVIPTRYVANNLSRIPLTILAAQKTGRLTLRSNSVVESIDVDGATGRAIGVRFMDRRSKERHTGRAKVIVLCASTIETLRIMLNSRSDLRPKGLGNSAGLVGRNLMDHAHFVLSGPHVDLEAEALGKTDAFDFGKIGGFYVPQYKNPRPAGGPYLRGFAIQGGIGRGYPFWFLAAEGEMLPQPQNRITLDPHKKDAWGIPVAHIDFTYSENENNMIADALATMKTMASAAGLEIQPTPTGRLLHNLAFKMMRKRLVLESGAAIPGSSVHEVGGAPMGDDPDKSVLNRFNQCWDAENVFVTDGASFVTCGAQNPTLTIMALTARACDYIVKEHNAGRWR